MLCYEQDDAHMYRLVRNRAIMKPYKIRHPIVYYGDEKMFIDTGAVTGSDIAKSMVIIPARGKDE